MLRSRFMVLACLAALCISPVRADDVKSQTLPRQADKILNAGVNTADVTASQALDIKAAIAELKAGPSADAGPKPAAQPADTTTPVTPESAVTAAESAKPATPPEPTLTAEIDLGAQSIVVSEYGAQIYTWAISSGTSEHPSPRGTFHPQWTAKMWFSKKYDNAPMPNAVFIHDGVAIHATQATGMLGRPASHGCIRLAPSNAATFYKLVNKHGLKMTKVSIYGTPNWRAPAVASRRQDDAPPRRYVQQRQDTSLASWFFDTPKYRPTSAYDGYNRQVYRRPPPPPGYRYVNQMPVRAYRTYDSPRVQYIQPQRMPRRIDYNRYSSGW